jgi:hypothetical protein
MERQNGKALACLGNSARTVFAPYGVSRMALLGAAESPGCSEGLHLLIEFAPGAGEVHLVEWLRLQRRLEEQCDCRVELISVARLEEQVPGDSLDLTVLYDASTDG